jgi:tyrosinase
MAVHALRVRKNQAHLTSTERERFVNAVKTMKSTGAYDYYVKIHIESMSIETAGADMNMWAHQRPGFLPWHRQLILDFENDLRTADMSNRGVSDTDMALPYWDWVNYHARKHFLWWGRIWGDNFMGPDGDSGDHDKVKSGPFRDGQWTCVYAYAETGPPYLQRTLGRGGTPPIDTLPTQEQWDAAQAISTYDTAPWDTSAGFTGTPTRFQGVTSYRNCNEGWVTWQDGSTVEAPTLHNRVHVWVGGSMAPISSPNDPIFFLHHCNVDRMWADWWNRLPAAQKTAFYVPLDGVPNPPAPPAPDMPIQLQGHHLDDDMPPWDGQTRQGRTPPHVRPVDVFDHHHLGYRYDTDPPQLGAATP